MSNSRSVLMPIGLLISLVLTTGIGSHVSADKDQKTTHKLDCEVNTKIKDHSDKNKVGPINQVCESSSNSIRDSTIIESSANNGDQTPPTVESTDPADNDNNVPLDTTLTVTFSEDIDKNSIDTGSLTLDPDIGSSPSIQIVSVNSNTAVFTLSNNLLPNTNYLATISSNIQDNAGNFLDCSSSSGVDSLCQWSFSTGTG